MIPLIPGTERVKFIVGKMHLVDPRGWGWGGGAEGGMGCLEFRRWKVGGMDDGENCWHNANVLTASTKYLVLSA